MRNVLFMTTVLSFIFTSSVCSADVSGTWALTMMGPMGEESFDISIQAEGENLAVTAAHPFLNEMKGTGALKGDALNFNLKASGGMPIEFAFTGKLSPENKMGGTVTISGFPSGPGAPGGQGQPPGGEQGGPWSAVKK